MMTTKTYVNYLVAAGFFPEDDVREVKSRDPQSAKKDMPKRSFAFYFFDQTSTEQEGETLVGKAKNHSGKFYPDAKLWTAEELKKAGRDKDGSCLYSNAVSNGGKLIECNLGNWQPFNDKTDKIV